MKIMKGLSAAFAATCAFAAITAVASVGSRTGYSFYGGTQNDTIPTAGKMLPGEVAQDTTAFKGKPYEGSDIMLTARAYGDRIVLPVDLAWVRDGSPESVTSRSSPGSRSRLRPTSTVPSRNATVCSSVVISRSESRTPGRMLR